MTYPNNTTVHVTYTEAEMAEREAHAARVAWANTMRLRLDRDSRRTVLRAWGAVPDHGCVDGTVYDFGGPFDCGICAEPVFSLTRKVQR